MAFFGFMNVYTLRVDVSVAIVAMMNYTALAALANKSSNGSAYCGDVSHGKKVINSSVVSVMWNNFVFGNLFIYDDNMLSAVYL